MGGGWPCFVVAISMIGLLTAIVGDLAARAPLDGPLYELK